ncbi:bifunctional Delta(1)-pyrroline-2-carboxylate/Delta(1)-piperideine-2-carboxylate reductase [Undibacterium parvum]|uniref:Ornithine cyclodeaminase family protein n=1 Tax=Undibacterium parvum TaxID=401471 RepID=A0A3S9HH07_9BURK|nr:ornithine cyclodeaminase family protein [Undibacterium parvum]AZP11395.1 ornithine cyclodeaminase family protein [Undibacterium parvum]
MKLIDADQVNRSLQFPALIAALDQGFQQEFGMPQRQVFALSQDPLKHDGFAVLPARNQDVIGVKAFTYFPENAQQDYASLYSKILLFSREHGVPLAMVDGTSVTYWRTAAVSALASRYLSRANSQRLLLLGTGKLAIPLVIAHLTVRELTHVFLWGRNAAKRTELKQHLELIFPHVEFMEVQDLAASTALADIIVSATGSSAPLILGASVRAGSHVDLLGNHSPAGRECDSALIQKAAVFVDSRQNVLNEAGELLIPIQEGLFQAADIKGELADLCSKKCAGRERDDEITLFKSVGTALSDLIAAHLVLKSQ